MSESSSEEQEDRAIGDEQLPEDLQPGEDNPLAEGLNAEETAGDLGPGELLEEGKPADQWEDGEPPERSGEQDSASEEDSAEG